MQPDLLAKRVYETAHVTGDFILRSGARSSEYFDKYLFEADPGLLQAIADAMVKLLPDRVDALAGLELGGAPIATVVSQLTGLPTLFVRKQAKTYGTCRLAEGGDVAGRRLIIVEDVVSSGGAVLHATRALRDRGAEICMAVCVIDRETGGSENQAAEGLELRSVWAMAQLKAASQT